MQGLIEELTKERDALKAKLEAYEKELTRRALNEQALRDKLREYGSHQGPCAYQPMSRECSCGLDAALAQDLPSKHEPK